MRYQESLYTFRIIERENMEILQLKIFENLEINTQVEQTETRHWFPQQLQTTCKVSKIPYL